MAEDYIYNGKPISSYSLWELGHIERSLKEAEVRREEASKHPKFNTLKFPAPNPEFLKLKNAIAEEIRKKQNG